MLKVKIHNRKVKRPKIINLNKKCKTTLCQEKVALPQLLSITTLNLNRL